MSKVLTPEQEELVAHWERVENPQVIALIRELAAKLKTLEDADDAVADLRAQLTAERERSARYRSALEHYAPTRPFGDSHSWSCPCRRPEETLCGPGDCVCVARQALADPEEKKDG